ncbi:MAG: hypothetical protein ABFD97_11900 [Syntrophobacter sp.]
MKQVDRGSHFSDRARIEPVSSTKASTLAATDQLPAISEKPSTALTRLMNSNMKDVANIVASQ